MAENTSNKQNDGAISDEQLEQVSGGSKIQKTRLEGLDSRDSSKSIDNLQETRLENLDSRDSSK